MDGQMVKVSGEQEDGTDSISTAMTVHGISKHLTQGNVNLSRVTKITKQAKTCCSCTWSLACKTKLCKCKRAGTACRRCNYYRV